MKFKTYTPKEKDIQRIWHLIDLDKKILGRASTQIAGLLIGKHKPYYAPHLDCGDYVVAVNLEKMKISGKKEKQKMYYHHSGYPGGFKQLTYSQVKAKDPKKILELAVKGMIPKNKLRDKRLRRLKIFINDQHPYQEKLNQQSVKEKNGGK